MRNQQFVIECGFNAWLIRFARACVFIPALDFVKTWCLFTISLDWGWQSIEFWFCEVLIGKSHNILFNMHKEVYIYIWIDLCIVSVSACVLSCGPFGPLLFSPVCYRRVRWIATCHLYQSSTCAAYGLDVRPQARAIQGSRKNAQIHSLYWSCVSWNLCYLTSWNIRILPRAEPTVCAWKCILRVVKDISATLVLVAFDGPIAQVSWHSQIDNQKNHDCVFAYRAEPSAAAGSCTVRAPPERATPIGQSGSDGHVL